jgi:threonyl-tRNA synthetase
MSTVQADIAVNLPDGSTKCLTAGSTCADLAQTISSGLYKKAVGAVINDELKDLYTPVQDGDNIKILTAEDPQSLELLRHSTAHVMAQAVQNLFPRAKIAIGPTIDDGFYYDFEITGHALTPEDLEKIEKEMKRISESGQRIVRYQIPDIDKQLNEFKTQGEKFKAELLEEHRNNSPTLYLMKDKEGKVVWNDLCRGPHLSSTNLIKCFKLLKVSGSYWRGDEKREQLQRIYACAFWSKQDLDDYLHRLEEAEKRDHRKLSKQLDLFSVHDEVGPGLIFWHPNLAVVRSVIEDFWRDEHRRRGYQLVYTPHIASEQLYSISGHLETYSDNMYSPMDIDGQAYRAKPMNCPGHIMIYKSRLHSYRDLPIRLAELGTVYRYERSGVLHGMLRVRGFTQDDSHIFCTPAQLENEIIGVLDLVDHLMKTFGYTYKAYLSTRPEKYLGTDEEWELATNALEAALKRRELDYEIDKGGGVFYAPKIDIKLFDAIGREWQGPTVQVDLNLPNRFEVTYVGEDGNRHKAIMIHRAVLGSMERFCGGLIEHYAGSFPLWLAPTQIVIIPIADRHHEAAQLLAKELFAKNIRAHIDQRSETLNYRIREAQMQQVPYMAVIGDKEAANQLISVRHRRHGDLGSMPIEQLLEKMTSEINSRSLDS